MKRVIYVFIMMASLLMAAENSKYSILNTLSNISTEAIITDESLGCFDWVENQVEDLDDVSELCVKENKGLQEGNYNGLWSSTATNGSVYKDLKITATITKVSETEYSGVLFISDNYTSCCKTKGNEGDGPITITIVDGIITFNWVDKISFCLGEFNGTGTYTEDNKFVISNLTGKDCEGDHIGSLEFFK